MVARRVLAERRRTGKPYRAACSRAKANLADAGGMPHERMRLMAAPSTLPPLRHDRARGVLMRLAAVTCFSIMAAAIKLASARGAATPEIMFYRALFGLPPLLAWIAWRRQWRAWRTRRPLAHLTRALIGLSSMLLSFSALALLPLAESTTISFIAPLFALALSAPLLGEHVGAARWAAVAIGFGGVVVVMQPGGSALPLFGTIVALAAAFALACVTITLRSISRTESIETTVLYFTLFAAAVTGALLPWFGAGHDGSTWLLLLATGLFGGVGQIGLTASLRFAPIAVLAPIDYLQLIFAILFGWLLFDAQPALSTSLGAVLIIGSVLMTLRVKPQSADLESRPVIGD
jgi:drug/metabolite transporter (DMT)-like permease